MIDMQDGTTLLYAGCGDNNIHVWDIGTGDHTVSIECVHIHVL